MTAETVNLASRLESTCEDFKPDIVLSPETFALATERFLPLAAPRTYSFAL